MLIAFSSAVFYVPDLYSLQESYLTTQANGTIFGLAFVFTTDLMPDLFPRIYPTDPFPHI